MSKRNTFLPIQVLLTTNSSSHPSFLSSVNNSVSVTNNINNSSTANYNPTIGNNNSSNNNSSSTLKNNNSSTPSIITSTTSTSTATTSNNNNNNGSTNGNGFINKRNNFSSSRENLFIGPTLGPLANNNNLISINGNQNNNNTSPRSRNYNNMELNNNNTIKRNSGNFTKFKNRLSLTTVFQSNMESFGPMENVLLTDDTNILQQVTFMKELKNLFLESLQKEERNECEIKLTFLEIFSDFIVTKNKNNLQSLQPERIYQAIDLFCKLFLFPKEQFSKLNSLQNNFVNVTNYIYWERFLFEFKNYNFFSHCKLYTFLKKSLDLLIIDLENTHNDCYTNCDKNFTQQKNELTTLQNIFLQNEIKILVTMFTTELQDLFTIFQEKNYKILNKLFEKGMKQNLLPLKAIQSINQKKNLFEIISHLKLNENDFTINKILDSHWNFLNLLCNEFTKDWYITQNKEDKFFVTQNNLQNLSQNFLQNFNQWISIFDYSQSDNLQLKSSKIIFYCNFNFFEIIKNIFCNDFINGLLNNKFYCKEYIPITLLEKRKIGVGILNSLQQKSQQKEEEMSLAISVKCDIIGNELTSTSLLIKSYNNIQQSLQKKNYFMILIQFTKLDEKKCKITIFRIDNQTNNSYLKFNSSLPIKKNILDHYLFLEKSLQKMSQNNLQNTLQNTQIDDSLQKLSQNSFDNLSIVNKENYLTTMLKDYSLNHFGIDIVKNEEEKYLQNNNLQNQQEHVDDKTQNLLKSIQHTMLQNTVGITMLNGENYGANNKNQTIILENGGKKEEEMIFWC
ncbi:hypothetical protein ABK040_002548 [Willaertia magna]